MSSSDHNNIAKTAKRSSWRWWQSTKTPDKKDNNQDCASSVAPSSLLVHHSIHSKESDEILSTASIKSKPWTSQKLKNTSICPTQHEGDIENEADLNTTETLQPTNKTERNNKTTTRSPSINHSSDPPITPSSSLLNNVPSITSSTVPVINFDPHHEGSHNNNRKSSDTTVFSGIRARLGKWVNSKADKCNNNNNSTTTSNNN